MIGIYTMNDKDIYSTYGLAVVKGVSQLLDLPDRKPSYKYDWGGVDGIEVDLSAPVFEARTFTFDVVLSANGYDDFWTKYKALFEELSKPGLLRLYCADLGSTFDLYYTSSSNFNRYTRLRENKVILTFTLVFTEPNPVAGGGDVYVFSQDGTNVISQDGTNKIQIK